MTFAPPTRKDVERLAAAHGLTLTAGELAAATGVLPGMLARLAALAEPDAPAPVGERRATGRPSRADDPYNAILRRCSVRGAAHGKLAGRRVGVKDSIAVAGLPLTAGSRFLGDYVPERDATIVTRLLDAGAEIVAIVNMDDLALSARGDTSAFGPVANPHDPQRLAGGSSSGSAAALFYDDVDLTIGGDQGGSIRIPASWCGVVGLKPTHGLVPYTGIVGVDATIDHVGPMARTVGEVARALEVIAGKDPGDPRQGDDVRADAYTAALGGGARGLRVGMLAEGFGLPGAEPDVDAAVRAAGRTLEALGAEVREVSVPDHDLAAGLLTPIVLEGLYALLTAHGIGHHFAGRYDRGLARAFATALRERPNDLPSSAKLVVLGGAFLAERHPGQVYGAAQNLRPKIRAAYDRVLGTVDVLAMPTTPMKAPLSDADVDPIDVITRGVETAANTAPFDVTGHPALSVPCGTSAGLPIGLMLVGRHFDEATILRVAAAFEQRAT